MSDNINATLEDLIAALDKFTECCSAGGERGGQTTPPDDMGSGDVEVGLGEQFESLSQYRDAKCKAANAIYDDVKIVIDNLDKWEVDLIAGGLAGGTSALLVGHILTGPLGWAALAVEIVVAAIAAYITTYSLSFDQVQGNLQNGHQDLVNALYNAGTAYSAQESFISVMASGTPLMTDIELGLIRLLLGKKMLNELFQPSQSTLNYISPNPLTCQGSIIVWDFDTDNEGFAFRDDSTGSYSASGQWIAGGHWEINLVGSGTLPGPYARGLIWKDGLSVEVDVGNSVQVDVGETSDGVSSSIYIYVKYADDSEYSKIVSSAGGSTTAILDIQAPGTIVRVEAAGSRNWTNPFNMTRDILEIRIQ